MNTTEKTQGLLARTGIADMTSQIKFRVDVSRAIKSKSLLSYEMALNVYDSLVLKASRGDASAKEALSRIG